MQNLNYKNYRIGLFLSMISALIIFLCSYLLGKNNFFLLLNTDLGILADYFFRFFSYLGDGILWVPLLSYFFYKNGKKSLFFLISCLIFTTLFTQISKIFILPSQARPTAAITSAFIHTVPGVIVHTAGSFPSGHTATAFVFYLIFCMVIKNPLWLVIGLLYALTVGYSRIYLAQHFPLDVAAGIVVAVVSVYLSLAIQNQVYKKKLP